jgi:hypothetical protein
MGERECMGARAQGGGSEIHGGATLMCAGIGRSLAVVSRIYIRRRGRRGGGGQRRDVGGRRRGRVGEGASRMNDGMEGEGRFVD